MTSFYKKLFVSEITDKSIFERKRIIKCVNIPGEISQPQTAPKVFLNLKYYAVLLAAEK